MPQVQSAADAGWRTRPKIDLHRHLEGSIPLNFVQRLAAEGRVPLPTDQALLTELITVNKDAAATPQSFLAPFGNIRKIFQDEATIREVAREVVKSAGQEGIRYLELHITPNALAHASGVPGKKASTWACQAVMAAAGDYEISVRIIISLNRHESVAAGEQAVQAAVDLQDQGVVGVDLAGDESEYGAEPFRDLLVEAKQAGLFVSLHAGEWAGSESVAFAIDQVQADRVIHGIRIINDPILVRTAQERRLPLVVCLTSNVQSGVVKSIEKHPLPLMLAAGLQVSLGTDDPAMSNTTLTRELELAQTRLGLGVDSLKGMMLAGTQAAFLEQPDRDALEQYFQKELGLAPPNMKAKASDVIPREK